MRASPGSLDGPDLIAPYGLNSSLCRAFIRDQNPCPGCRSGDRNKSNACLTCASLLHLDDRYRTKTVA